jgi:D-alanyl-D-alanine carboxypeptidase (penicillin-binding protein 5/6)
LALSAVLMNPATGEVLFAKEPHLRLPPASTTKVLTALVALERLDPNARVLVSAQGGQRAAQPHRTASRRCGPDTGSNVWAVVEIRQ